MKQYPSISKQIMELDHLIGFDKLDGSNIRAEWDKKSKRFTRFGSRKLLLAPEHPSLGKSIDLIRETYEEALTKRFLDLKYEKVTAFFEFFGDQSFAGHHEKDDSTQQVVLIDMIIYKKGLIHPDTFVQEFQQVGIPKILHTGKVDHELIRSIRERTLSGMSFEGVVFKGRTGKKNHLPVMFKIKSKEWLAKLKDFCRGDDKLFQKLA